MIAVTCAHCGLQILVPPTVQGKKGVCFNCGHPLTVPSVPTLAAASSDAPTPSPMSTPFTTPAKGAITPHPAPSVTREIDFAKGDRVAGRYVIEESIGRGGMGTVYRAHDALVNEDVALKFMRTSLLQTERARNLFLQEAQVARRLRHDKIIAVHDINFTPEGILYISMEFLEGEPLRDVIRRHRAERRIPDIRYAVRIIDQMLAGLEYAHKYVIHRDIKPENVMVMSNGRVNLLDFGLATAAVFDPPPAQTDAQRSTPRKVVGTLEYAAPEQRMGQPMDLRADIYAVGLVFREVLTLRSPVEDPWHIEECRRDVAPAVLDVAYKALAADRDNRWQDARSFREALHNAYHAAYKRVAVRAAQTSGFQGSTKDMVLFAGGTFLMGSNAVREEAPEEEVHVSPFWMDKVPVTVGQYAKYLKETGATPPKFWGDTDFDGDDQPVIGVSWQEALAYANWAGKTLPTEAQWEFAARGQDNRRFPWGNYPPDRNRCNFDGNLGLPTFTMMHEEGATPEGLLDMAGNVHEWTLDPYAPYQYFRRDPKSAEKAPKRTARGGSWESKADELTTTCRRGFFPDTQTKTLGFRCVIPVQDGE